MKHPKPHEKNLGPSPHDPTPKTIKWIRTNSLIAKSGIPHPETFFYSVPTKWSTSNSGQQRSTPYASAVQPVPLANFTTHLPPNQVEPTAHQKSSKQETTNDLLLSNVPRDDQLIRQPNNTCNTCLPISAVAE